MSEQTSFDTAPESMFHRPDRAVVECASNGIRVDLGPAPVKMDDYSAALLRYALNQLDQLSVVYPAPKGT